MAAILNNSRATVKQRMQRARQKLKQST
ncbi:MAG: hypothetical protein IKQ27_10010 [Lachnospiraceae bacterium]|nr:hypothetical protein [Lachnospiraceae bacterium]MBR6157282.1 hypothetical protein [Lachnospiraceae bacterium]